MPQGTSRVTHMHAGVLHCAEHTHNSAARKRSDVLRLSCSSLTHVATLDMNLVSTQETRRNKLQHVATFEHVVKQRTNLWNISHAASFGYISPTRISRPQQAQIFKSKQDLQVCH